MECLTCDEVAKGRREAEGVAVFRDLHGRRDLLRVERDFLEQIGGKTFPLPVGIVQRNADEHAVLIELPHEAETGVHRIWARTVLLQPPHEAVGA